MIDADQLLESFEFRFTASGVRKPKRTAEELLAHVFGCSRKEVHTHEMPEPLSSGKKIEMIRQMEDFAVRIEEGEAPQAVLGCLDY